MRKLTNSVLKIISLRLIFCARREASITWSIYLWHCGVDKYWLSWTTCIYFVLCPYIWVWVWEMIRRYRDCSKLGMTSFLPRISKFISSLCSEKLFVYSRIVKYILFFYINSMDSKLFHYMTNFHLGRLDGRSFWNFSHWMTANMTI